MDQIMDENAVENNENQLKVTNKSVANNERRVLAPIPITSKNVLVSKQAKKSTNGSLKSCDDNQKLWLNLKSNSCDQLMKTDKTCFGQNQSSKFEIFDESEVKQGSNNQNENENLDIILEKAEEDMDSCERTDNLLSECTEISLAIEEDSLIHLSESDIRCEETIDLDTDDEESEENSVSENTSEIYRSFDLTALSKCKEYANEIHKYLLFYERQRMADPFYIGKQPEINAKMRSILVDWLVEVAEEYKLLDQTLFLAVNYIDRFLSLMSVSRQSFQLLGTAALFISTKYEEIYPPDLSEFVYITDDSYSKSQILNMEKLILKALQFDVSAPTTYYFIEKFSSELELPPIVRHLSKYLCHLTLLESEPFLRFYPSEIAISSIILSAQTLGLGAVLSHQFIEHSVEFEKDLKGGDVSQLLAERQTCLEALHRMHAFSQKHPQQAIQTKYMSDKLYRVSAIEPMVTCPSIY